ncbi:Anaerobic nitric oxide reductase flavorubredoxin [bioreactor metagenome]|uniref:Anaerobic nitric oxide reductase flavorubredoxin n=1 Tax=bioreactor metagenome TaxID=1076179 RepID=A0A645DJP7_9ZZZZ
MEWASAYQENQITIVYETMYNGTRSIAESIVKGINSEDQVVDIKLYNIATNDLNDIITEIFKSKAVFIGSPTVNNGIMSHTAGLMEMVKGLKFKGKKGAAFGCFGWSDASTKIIMNLLKESGFEIVGESISCNWGPDEDAMQRAFDFGRSVVSKSEI